MEVDVVADRVSIAGKLAVLADMRVPFEREGGYQATDLRAPKRTRRTRPRERMTAQVSKEIAARERRREGADMEDSYKGKVREQRRGRCVETSTESGSVCWIVRGCS